MKLLISFFSVFFDIFLLNIFKMPSYNISYFYPMFTISAIVYISNFYPHSNRKNYYLSVLLLAIIYDTLVVNNLLITVSLFELIALFNIKIRKYLSSNLFNNLIFLILTLLIYDFGFHLMLVLVGYQEFNFYLLFYKFSHSVVLNIIYMITMFLVLKPRKT